MHFAQRKVFALRNDVEANAAALVPQGVRSGKCRNTRLPLLAASGFVALLLAESVVGHAHTLYKIIDASGRVTYSDHVPTSDGSIQIIKITRVHGVLGDSPATGAPIGPAVSANAGTAAIVPVVSAPGSNSMHGASSSGGSRGGGGGGASGASLAGTNAKSSAAPAVIRTAAATSTPAVATPTSSPTAATSTSSPPVTTSTSTPTIVAAATTGSSGIVPVAAPAPAPAPAPAATPIPTAQPTFLTGAAVHIGPGYSSADFLWPGFAAANINAVRFDIMWQWVEKQKGQYVLDRAIDNFVFTAKNKGIAPLVILDYGNPLYDGGGFPVSDEAQTAFANYAAFIASRYKGTVKYYEVWNEWSGNGSYSQSTADQYAKLLSKVNAALKAVDPQIVVLAGDLNGAYDLWSWYLYNNGTLNNSDGFSVHPYVYPGVPESAIDTLTRLEGLAKDATGRDVPLYVTEIGWPTCTGSNCVSRSTAADYLARFYLLAPMYSFIKATSWYDFHDDGQDPNNQEANFGLYEFALGPKPAACAMGDVSRLTASYTAISARRDTNGVWVARYSNGTTSVFAVWTQDPGATTNATVSTASPGGALIDARGICKNANVLSGNGSTLLRVVISNSPTIFTTVSDDILVQ